MSATMRPGPLPSSTGSPRREASAAFGWAERDMMLHAVTLKSHRAPVVHVHRKRYRNGAFGVRRPFPVVLVDVQIIGDDAKLLAGHLKNFVVVNRVYRYI